MMDEEREDLANVHYEAGTFEVANLPEGPGSLSRWDRFLCWAARKLMTEISKRVDQSEGRVFFVGPGSTMPRARTRRVVFMVGFGRPGNLINVHLGRDQALMLSTGIRDTIEKQDAQFKMVEGGS